MEVLNVRFQVLVAEEFVEEWWIVVVGLGVEVSKSPLDI